MSLVPPKPDQHEMVIRMHSHHSDRSKEKADCGFFVSKKKKKTNKRMLSVRLLPVLGRPCRPPTTHALRSPMSRAVLIHMGEVKAWRKHAVTDCRGFTERGDESTGSQRLKTTALVVKIRLY